MSEEMSENVELKLESAIEGECCGEECGNCGEVHEGAVDLDVVLKKQKRWYRATVVAYFISLAATAYCVYELLGVWGAAACVSAFGVYFFHMNMVALVRVVMTLEQASFGAIMAGKQAQQEGDENTSFEGSGGNYA